MLKEIVTSMDSSDLKEIIRAALKEALSEIENKPQEKTVHVSRKEAAEILGVSLPTLNKYTKTGKVQAYRVGGKVVYKVNDLESCLKKIETR